MKPTLLVMAAGMGSRYGGLKQIDPVGPAGEIVIDYSIFDAVKAGFGKVVFIIRKEIEELFKEEIGNRFEGIIDVQYVFQEKGMLPKGYELPAERTKPWGTGHALLCAESAINEPFALINADDFYGKSAFKLLADYFSLNQTSNIPQFAMVGYTMRNTLSENGYVSRGICELSKDKMLQKVTEITEIFKHENGAKYANANEMVYLTGDETVSMNFWGFTPEIFPFLNREFNLFLDEKINIPKSEFYIPSVVDSLIHSGEAKAHVFNSQDRWFGVTYPEDKPMVVSEINKLVENGVYPPKLWN